MQSFPKLHAFCCLRAVRNCTLTKWPQHALPNQVKLHPSNERPHIRYASFLLAAVENGCCVSTRALFTTTTIFLFPSRNAVRTKLKAWQK